MGGACCLCVEAVTRCSLMWESPDDTADGDEEYLVVEPCQENLSVVSPSASVR